MSIRLILYLSILYGVTSQLITEREFSTPPTDITKSPSETESETVVASTETPIPTENCRNDTQWTCTDRSKCIGADQTCDGMIDCLDGSDEYMELCRDREPRPMFGLVLHCSYYCSEFHDKLCPQICCHEPQYCYYALMAENGEPNTCRLPSYPEHGNFSITPYKNQTSEDRTNFWLNYHCDETYVLVESERIECLNGELTVTEKPPYCSEACPLNHNPNFTYICPKNNGNVTCGNYVAINTPVFVTSLVPKPDADPAEPEVTLPMLCKSDKTYNLTTSCVEEVDKLQQAFEHPTMEKMTEYETKFNTFKTNETGHDFESLVNEFHIFETNVKNTLAMMHTKAEQCDITLDLLIWDLSLKIEKKHEDAEKQTTGPITVE